MKRLKDTDLMTIGSKYVGEPMIEVPAMELLRLWESEGLKHDTEFEPVAEYIQRNLMRLRQEAQKRFMKPERTV